MAEEGRRCYSHPLGKDFCYIIKRQENGVLLLARCLRVPCWGANLCLSLRRVRGRWARRWQARGCGCLWCCGAPVLREKGWGLWSPGRRLCPARLTAAFPEAGEQLLRRGSRVRMSPLAGRSGVRPALGRQRASAAWPRSNLHLPPPRQPSGPSVAAALLLSRGSKQIQKPTSEQESRSHPVQFVLEIKILRWKLGPSVYLK